MPSPTISPAVLYYYRRKHRQWFSFFRTVEDAILDGAQLDISGEELGDPTFLSLVADVDNAIDAMNIYVQGKVNEIS